jgi:hypothetical protein
MVVISSFEPEEIDTSRAKALGLLHLREFLAGAKRGFEGGGDAAHGSALADRHRMDVRRSLEERGLKVGEDVGLSPFRIDLAVTRPDDPQWRVAVLLDGARWRDRATVGDRDGLPVQVLQRLMGWMHVVRIWLPSWRAEKEALLDEIESLVLSDPPSPTADTAKTASPEAPMILSQPHAAADAPIAAAGALLAGGGILTKPPTDGIHGAVRGAATGVDATFSAGISPQSEGPQEPVLPAGASIAESLRRAGAEDFRPFEWNGPRGNSEQCAEKGGSPMAVQTTIRRVLELEGPIEINRLVGFVGDMFNVKRISGGRRKFIVDCIPPHCRQSDDRGEYIWPESINPATWSRVRLPLPDSPGRSIEEIPTQELVNAFVLVTRMAGQIPKDELLQVAANAFGVKRVTQGIQTSLMVALRTGLKSGALQEDGGGTVRTGD